MDTGAVPETHSKGKPNSSRDPLPLMQSSVGIVWPILWPYIAFRVLAEEGSEDNLAKWWQRESSYTLDDLNKIPEKLKSNKQPLHFPLPGLWHAPGTSSSRESHLPPPTVYATQGRTCLFGPELVCEMRGSSRKILVSIPKGNQVPWHWNHV